VVGPTLGVMPYTGLSTAAVIVGAHREPSGRIWLIDVHGKLVAGDLDHGFMEQPKLVATETIAAMDGSHGGAPFELFALTQLHAVWHFDGTAWSRFPGPTGPMIDRSSNAIAWVAPGAASAIGRTLDKVLEASGGHVEEQTLDLPARPTEDSLYAIRWVDGFGPVIGTRWSTLFLREGDLWRALSVPAITSRVTVLTALPGGGLLFGGESGILAQYHRGYGYCDSMRYLANEPRTFGPLGGGIALFTDQVGIGVSFNMLTPL
jgi:hypothetical protein